MLSEGFSVVYGTLLNVFYLAIELYETYELFPVFVVLFIYGALYRFILRPFVGSPSDLASKFVPKKSKSNSED